MSVPGRFSVFFRGTSVDVSIYKEDGKLVQHFSVMNLPTRFRSVKSITMNRQGRIALSISFFGGENDEILVI